MTPASSISPRLQFMEGAEQHDLKPQTLVTLRPASGGSSLTKDLTVVVNVGGEATPDDDYVLIAEVHGPFATYLQPVVDQGLGGNHAIVFPMNATSVTLQAIALHDTMREGFRRDTNVDTYVNEFDIYNEVMTATLKPTPDYRTHEDTEFSAEYEAWLLDCFYFGDLPTTCDCECECGNTHSSTDLNTGASKVGQTLPIVLDRGKYNGVVDRLGSDFGRGDLSQPEFRTQDWPQDSGAYVHASYNSSYNPHPTVTIYARMPTFEPGYTPARVEATLTIFKNDISGTHVDTTSYYNLAGVAANQNLMFSLQADASALAAEFGTNAYDWEVALVYKDGSGNPINTYVTAEYASDLKVTSYTQGPLLVTDRINSELGNRWGIKELSRVKKAEYKLSDEVDDDRDVLIYESGDGNVTWFFPHASGYRPQNYASGFVKAENSEGLWKVYDRHGNIETFFDSGPSVGLPSKRIDAFGSEWNYAYADQDADADIDLRITTSTGWYTTFYYYQPSGGPKLIDYVESSDGRRVDFTYSQSGATWMLDYITLPNSDGSPGSSPTTQFTYWNDVSNDTLMIKTVKDVATNEQTEFTYGADRAVSKIKRPNGAEEFFSAHQTSALVFGTSETVLAAATLPNSRESRQVDENGGVWTRKMDRFGRVTHETDPNGATTRYVRDQNGYVMFQIGADPDGAGPRLGAVTRFEYDNEDIEYTDYDDRSLGFVTKVTLPNGGVRSYTYTEFNSGYRPFAKALTGYTDEQGRHTDYEVDSHGAVRMVRQVVGEADDITWDQTLAKEGYLSASVTDDIVTLIDYTTTNELGHVKKLTVFNGAASQVTRFNYDANGLLTSQELPQLATEASAPVRTFIYDTRKNLDKYTDELGRTVDYDFDARDRLTKATYPSATTPAPFEQYAYDTLNRMTSFTDVNGQLTTYAYSNTTLDGEKVLKVVVTHPPREALGVSPATEEYYDAHGNLVKMVGADPDGVGAQERPVWLQAFDKSQRLVQRTLPDPDGVAGAATSPLVTYGYDRLGRLISEIEPADFRNMNEATGFWPNMAPTTEAGLLTDVTVTTGIPRTEIDLFGVFKDDQDADTALGYSIQSVGGSASYFDAISITPTNPRKLVIEYTGTVDFMDVPITVRATDTSGLIKDVTFTVDRTQSQHSVEFRLNDTGTSGTQKRPALAATPDGGFVSVWENAANGSIRIRSFDQNGSALGAFSTETQVNTSTGVLEPSLAVRSDGTIVVAYWQPYGGDWARLLFRRYYKKGSGVWGWSDESEVYDGNQGSFKLTDPWRSSIAFLNNDEFVFAWHGPNVNDSRNILMRRYTASGSAAYGGFLQVNSTSTSSQLKPTVAATSDGGYVVVWDGNGSGDTAGVFSRKYLANDSAVGSEQLINRTTTGSQSGAVTPSGGYVVVWYGQGVDAQTGASDNAGVFARLRGADGTPASGEILVNQTTTDTQQSPAVAILPNGGFVVAWQGNTTSNGTEIYVRRFSAAGLPLDNEQIVNSTPSLAQTDAAVTVTKGGAVVAAWGGNGAGVGNVDSAGVFARFANPYDESNTLVGPFRVLSVSPAETMVGRVEKLLINFSAPLNSATVAVGAFEVIGPGGDAVSLGTPALISATQVLLPLSTAQSTTGTYYVTVKSSIGRSAVAGGGQLDQDLDGTPGEGTEDYGQFAFFVTNSNEIAPVVTSTVLDRTISIGSSDTVTAQSTIDLTTHFQDAEQPASELLYTVTGIADTGGKLLRWAEVSEFDGHTLVLQYNPGEINSATVTVRATDRSGRYVEAPFTVSRSGTGLAGSVPLSKAFQVTSIGTGSVFGGPVDSVVVTFNDPVGSVQASDFVIKDPNGTEIQDTATLIATNQVLVTLDNYTTLLGAYNVQVKRTISRAGGENLNQDRDKSAGETNGEDDFLTTIYFAPGPRHRQEYNDFGQVERTIDPLGNATSFGYTLAGELRWQRDALSRTTSYNYDAAGRLTRVTSPSLSGTPPYAQIDNSDSEFVADSSYWDDDPDLGAIGNSYVHATTGNSAKVAEWRFEADLSPAPATGGKKYAQGKTYEVLVRWVNRPNVNVHYELIDGAEVESVFANQASAPTEQPWTDFTWFSLGVVTIDSAAFTVRLNNTTNAEGDAVRLVEVPQGNEFTYDQAGNLKTSTDAAGSVYQYVYDNRNRLTDLYAPDPATGAAEPPGPRTQYVYDALGQVTSVIDPLGSRTDYLYDAMGRLREALDPLSSVTATPQVVTVDEASTSGYTSRTDAAAYGNDYRFHTGSTMTSWTANGLTAGKYYQVLVSWRGDTGDVGADPVNTTDAKYRIMDGVDERGVYHVNQRVSPSDWYDAGTSSTTDASWKRLGVFRVKGTSLKVELTRIANDGEVIADAMRVIEVGADTSFDYDAVGNLIQVKEPDLGANIFRPTTDYTYDKHYNLKTITLPDPDGGGVGGTQYTSSTIQYAYDDLDRLIEQTDERSAKTAYKYDGLGRLTKLIQANAATGLAESGGNPVGAVTQFQYDPRGNLVRTTDALGRVTQTLYDALDRPFSGIDPLGFRTFVDFDAAGQATRLVDQLGRATVPVYDALGRVTSITKPDPDAAGSLTAPVYTFEYDLLGNRTKMTEPDPDGAGGGNPLVSSVTYYEYDKLSRLTKVKPNDPDGVGTGDPRPELNYTYTANSQVQTITEKLSASATRTWTREYDRLGRLTKSIQPTTSGAAGGPTTVYGYDALGNLTSETLPDPDASGAGTLLPPVTNWTYDALGRVTQQQLPDPDDVQGTTNPQGRPTTTYTYDAASNLTLLKTPNPDDQNHAGTAVIETQYAYDYLGRQTTATRNDPSSTVPQQITSYGYDLLGNLTRVAEPDPDGSGSLTSPVTYHLYDVLNRETSTVDPREGITRYTYDGAGNLASLTDPVLNTTTWTYDRLDRMTVDMNTLGDARRYTYDAVDRQTKYIDRDGRVTKYSYDPLNRRTKEEWFTNEADTTSNRTIAWDYDIADRLEGVTDRDGQTTPQPQGADYNYTYDAQSNVELVTANLVGLDSSQNIYLAQTYDNLGRRKDSKALIGSAPTTGTKDYVNTYKFDALSRLTRITQDDQPTGTFNSVSEKRADFVYNAVGQQQKVTRYSDVTGTTEVGHTDFDYDQFGRLVGLDHEKANNSVITGYDYVYDRLNRLTSVDFSTSVAGQDYNGEDATYTYDATGQVMKSDRPSTASDENYTFDLNGNRRIVDLANQQYGTNNRLVRDGYQEYTYDKEGNVTKRVMLDGSGVANGATTEFAYDHRNRLTQVSEKATPAGAATHTVKYDYDAFDRRVSKTVDTSPADGNPTRYEYYVWDGDDVVMDFVDSDGAGTGANVTLAKRYLWGAAIDQILAEETAGGATVWNLADRLGTVRDQVDNTGAYITGSHTDFGIFGYPLGTPSTRFLFTAQEFDADTGLYYYNARWYDPSTGRFMSVDPLGFAAGDANLMRYVGNSPTLYVDPTGNHYVEPQRPPKEDGVAKKIPFGPQPYSPPTSDGYRPPLPPSPEPPQPVLLTGSSAPNLEMFILPDSTIVYAERCAGEPYFVTVMRLEMLQEDLERAHYEYSLLPLAHRPDFEEWYNETWPEVRAAGDERRRFAMSGPQIKAGQTDRRTPYQRGIDEYRSEGRYVMLAFHTVFYPGNGALDQTAVCVGGFTGASPRSQPSRVQLGRTKGTPPNPGGKLGGQAHRNKVAERVKELQQQGHTIKHGGGKPEKAIETPGGKKDRRFPDITTEDSNGNTYHENIGKTNKDGTPVKRERDALDDIENETGKRPGYTPYDNNAPPPEQEK